jgi:hypothetical protein
MLAAFVSLRVFRIILIGGEQPERHLQYVTKASHQAPHLESFTIQDGNDNLFRYKRVNGNWVVC